MLADEPGDAPGQHRRFAAARAGEDQDRAIAGGDRLPLLLVHAMEETII